MRLLAAIAWVICVAAGTATAQGWDYCRSGFAAIEAGDLDRAIESFTDCIGQDDLLIDQLTVAYYNRGNAHLDKRHFERAIGDYDQALYLKPDYVPAYLNRGNAYQAVGDYARAIRDYDRVISIEPGYALAFLNRGNAYQGRGDYQRAIRDYDTVLRLIPDYAPAYLNRGNAHRGQGDLERAIGDYDAVLRLFPRFAQAYYSRGTAYHEKGDHDRALHDYDEASRLDSGYPPTYLNRGNLYLGRGDFDLAIQDYDTALRLDPRFALAHYNRGIAYYRKGARDLALRDYKEAVRLDRSYAEMPYDMVVRRQSDAPARTASGASEPARALETAPANDAPGTQGAFGAHLASVRSADGAEGEWDQLKQRFPDVIGESELIVRPVELEAQGTFFRVIAGPFETRSKAQALCAQLKSQEQYCQVLQMTNE